MLCEIDKLNELIEVTDAVLILVLMEDALRVFGIASAIVFLIVLILVLMEDALREDNMTKRKFILVES